MSTNPVEQLDDSTRETLAVDNSPRYFVGRSGIVHRTVRWAPCGDLVAPFAARVRDLPDGTRCSKCFPTSEVPRRSRGTGWPRGFHG